MKTTGFFLLLFLSIHWVDAQNLNPYILGLESSETIAELKGKVEESLTQNDVEVIGQYQPASDNNRWIIIFSSSELESAIKNVGGLSGFAAALRLAITNENGKTLVSYTNPLYWGNAYFRDDFEKVSSYYSSLNTKLENAMKASGNFLGTAFGSEEGISGEDLRKYRYMFGMPRFDDTVELKKFDSYQDAITKIEASLASKIPNLKQVYEISIPGKELTLYGFALSGEDGEEEFLPIIDIGTPKHTAFLPYEVLVMGGEVHMLHGRYRIALSFPDLTMGTFSKIMSTPGNIKDLLSQLVE